MDIKNLITFIHVAELNSFTKAAEKLGFSQSTVSFQVKQLETEFNSQLFERINRTVVLTEQGRKVLRYAYQIRQMTQELEENMQEDQLLTGHIRLAMADSLCNSLLSEHFDTFRRQYPGITLKVIAAGTEEMFRLINHNEVDAILTLDNHIYNTEYVIVQEEKVGMHFVAGKDSSFSTKSSISVQELVSQPFILTEKDMSYRRLMEEKLAGMSLEIQPILEIGSTNLICSLVEQGIGLSFLPDYVTEKGVRAGKIKYLEVDNFEIEIWKQLLYHRDKWISPQMESVLRYCVETEFSYIGIIKN
ncbi:MAG: LysR family transcriptional regulator [Lachnospiraceae bacterium]|nr:LysR family transcriptional regulator [Robinsoniella sp.]MDY3766046.1 LysR family transcriptional regulator [Lachnospiraceae bacterium]